MKHSYKFKIKFKATADTIQSVEEDIKNEFEVLKVDRFLYPYKCSVIYDQSHEISQDLVYNGNLYSLPIEVHFQNIPNQSLLAEVFEAVYSIWCTFQKGQKHCYWLIPLVSDYYREKASFHQDIETVEYAFGTLPTMNHFVQHYSFVSIYELLCTFSHSQKMFTLYVDIRHMDCNSDQRPKKINVRYNNIVRLFVNDNPSSSKMELFFEMSCPPFFFIEKLNPKQETNGEGSSCSSSYQERRWERVLNIGCICKKSYISTHQIGRLNVLKIVLNEKTRARFIIERLMHRCPPTTEFCFTYVHCSKVNRLFKNDHKISFMPDQLLSAEEENRNFDIQYAWDHLFSRSLQIHDQITLQYSQHSSAINIDYWGFLKSNLQRYQQENDKALCSTLFHIGEMLHRSTLFTFMDALKVVFLHYCNNEETDDLPHGMCFVKRMILSPSRRIFLPPMESFDNRIIREFPEAKKYMLRVSIQDDSGLKLTFALQYHTMKGQFVNSIVGDVLRNGIFIGHRHYQILASSSSQLREHGVWFYATDSGGRTAETIRQWMGNFSHIKNVAKYMARMGQCFSTSDEGCQVSVSNDNEFTIPDIKIESSSGEYTFSDGIGKISSELAEMIRTAKEEQIRKPPGTEDVPVYKPSAFQIRYKGCKGMVCEDPTMSGCTLCIRPSMEKFKCDTTSKLEIIKISAPRPLLLNRPLITILEQLGVDKDIFLALEKDMILDLTDSLIYEQKAVNLLDSHITLHIPFQQLLDSGICLTEEPFFRSLLIAVYRSSVRYLKRKARIAVPPQFGRNMLGVLDETKTLKYGEVFVQYSEQVGLLVSETHILTGIVVVTKNPCMHPGDVRKFNAVDVPALRHIKDCIVFPATGHRPHPDEMAGSDLDGDEYVVIWMEELIFPRDNFSPAKYTTVEKARKVDNIGENEMVKFLCEFILNDGIGTMAFAHLAWADISRMGIFSPECLKIAEKYSLALDFAKTGFTTHLSHAEKPEHFPDFMEKGAQCNTYRSSQALGVLYRFVKNIEACADKANENGHHKIEKNHLLEYPGWERYSDSAKKHYLQYTSRFTAILRKYNVETEAEGLSGCLGNTINSNMKQTELDNVALIVKSYLANMMMKYKYIFLNEIEEEVAVNGWSKDEKKVRTLQKASAWYMVTYLEPKCEVLSFAWVVCDKLVLVSKAVQEMRKSSVDRPESILLSSLDLLLNNNMKQAAYCDCPCVTVSQAVIHNWIKMSNISFAMKALKGPCTNCFIRIFNQFSRKTQKFCCSWADDGCLCQTSCQPSKIIIPFLKFYASTVIKHLGRCDSEECEGFRDFNLQAAALRTYVSFSIKREYSVLGLEDFEAGQDQLHSDSNVESDPVRISLTKDLKSLIETSLDEVKKLLKSMSGVKDIQLIPENTNQKEYLLVSSTGTSAQRWDLEQLVMEPNLAKILSTTLKLGNLRL